MRYTVCKAPRMEEVMGVWLHNWFSPPAWTAPLVCEEWYLQEVILPLPGVYAINTNGEDVVSEYDLEQLGIHPE